MKRNTLLQSLLSVFLGLTFFAASSSEAREQTHTTRYSQSAPDEDSSPAARYIYGLGLSTVNVTAFTNIPGFGNSTSITGIMSFTRYDMVHVFFSIPQTSPFNIGAMGLYKRILMESQYGGLHVGGGLGLGVFNTGIEANFAMNISAVAGIHFRLPSLPQLEAHLDGGPTFYVVNTSPQSSSNFQIAALSPALGLSVLYRF